jgi:hypothetical protein
LNQPSAASPLLEGQSKTEVIFCIREKIAKKIILPKKNLNSKMPRATTKPKVHAGLGSKEKKASVQGSKRKSTLRFFYI